MITILSPTARYRARLCDRPGGVYVAVRDHARPGHRRSVLLSAGLIDAPFHVVADRVLDALADLEEAV